MTLEATLERIAVALEAMAANGTAPTGAVKADAAAPKAAKPAKAATAEKPAAAKPAPEPEVDPFAAVDEPAVVLTRDDVRKALLACQERLGPAAAQAVFKKAAGVDTLPALKDDSKFAAIIAAANAA